ncbi:mucin-desulfating sulfatase [Anaeromyces robustus]|jgi:Ser/Thr protein kinase RdoA (MazF antagonist)|uniref:Mucin-desulfating sulfatase n=1 Tax=Anaeromyces robustus TaxID=1754192 RepID=A0A1Y1VUC7_9FUNG|nr:mucin-desulfating sulfatase [Anaeromyces robustus]|eukprot:ORX64887.1 mucin-desulfating sulfatase [Anaeromyces robustus]
MKELFAIAGHFIDQKIIENITPLGNGLINDTYKIIVDGAPKYVLQRINNEVFSDVEMLQNNIEAVTNHIRHKYEIQGINNIEKHVLHFLKADTGKTYILENEKYWRVMDFIDDSFTYEDVTPEYAYYAGRSFGDFESLLTDLESPIGEIIPDFHNIEFRLQQLNDAITNDKAGRMKEPEVQEYVAKIKAKSQQMCLGEKLYHEGKLPKRICHCDTKVNNMLFDKDGNVLCVIDLDTVMPSFIFSDFGDFLRSAANTGAEDDPNLDNIHFNMEIFKAFTKGYLEGTKSFLLPIEKENLPYAATLFPYMQAVRFLTDYINGDIYYKTNYANHNIVRTKAQWRLFEETEAHLEEVKEVLA